jgi:SAM-dependent methyltransferase
MTVDFGRRAEDYATYRPGLPESFYERLAAFTRLGGARAVDLGTGPGVMALELARRGAIVVGIDISPRQIEAARRRASREHLADRCTFKVAPAEGTGLSSGSFDLATAGQCWGWFDHVRACREVRRLLRPGGWLVVAHYAYLPRHSDIARMTEELVLEMNPSWTMANCEGHYPQRIDALIEGGFAFVEQFCYDHVREFTHEAWRGRMRTCNGVGTGDMSDEQVAAFDAELARRLADRFPEEPLRIAHRVWAVVVRQPEAAS